MSRVVADRYEVKGVLGEGGTGIVYDAVRTADAMPVALKVMHAKLAGDKQIRGRFQREAKILRALEGPHVCPILDFGEVPGEEAGTTLVFLALPKIDGPSLDKVLEEGLIDVDRALDIMLDVCAALSSAHAVGIIHRDLKPANVLLKGGTNAIVVDFGMSKIVTGQGTGNTTNLTTHNMVFGTPEYMSPEQARGDDLDARCDVYAAGVMLYEMLTGEQPFTGNTPLSVLTAHLTSELVPPSRRAAPGRLTPAIESVIVHALARDRERRYPSASALAAAIRHARAMPEDVASLQPESFGSSPPGTDAFAATIPSIEPVKPDPSVPPPVLREKRETTPSKIPSTLKSPRLSSKPPPPPENATKTWILLWVLVGLASIGAGVYFALRR